MLEKQLVDFKKEVGDRFDKQDEKIAGQFDKLGDKIDSLFEEKNERKGGVKAWHLLATVGATVVGWALQLWFGH